MRALVLALVAACGGAPPKPVTPRVETPPPSIARYIVGGDSRNDKAHVLPWAFQEARVRDAGAFVFLGDMEIIPSLDDRFEAQLGLLGPIPFYPVLGNHEVRTFGVFSSGNGERFRKRFLETPRTPVKSSIPHEIVYSVYLPGGVHFVALDNVSQKGFGADQLAWIDANLKAARADASVRYVMVGMHKALAKNGISNHAMDEDGDQAVVDSDAALELFVRYRVTVIFASHVHEYAAFVQGGIPSYITGGLGAPLHRHAPKENAFHHFLQVDVEPTGLKVSVVRFEGGHSEGDED